MQKRSSRVASAAASAALVLLMLAALLALPAMAQSSVPFGFKNLEGQAADGLHLVLDTRSSCFLQVVDAGPFTDATVNRRVATLRGGGIARRESVRILVSTSCAEPPTVREWWWLDGSGDRIGVRRRPRAAEDTSISSLYERRDALQVVSFVTAEGRIELYLTPRISAGDTLSGSLAFTPSGEDRQRGRNAGALRGYSLELAGRSLGVGQETWTQTLPSDLAGIAEVTLWDVTGELVAANAVELVPTQAPSEVYRIPRFTQGGEPFLVEGPFDGDSSTTGVRLGDNPASLLAESPRAAVLRAPRRPVGKVEIGISEGESEAAGELRNLDIRVVAPRPTIETGERLELRVEVDGLEGLDGPLRLEVVNNSLALAHFPDGTLSPTLTLDPEQVPPGGRVSLPIELEGSQGGVFDVEARLATDG